MKKLDEKFGENTLKAAGTVLGITKKDYTGQNIPRSKRAKDNITDFLQTAAASSAVMGGVSHKSFIIPASIFASKVIGARRQLKQREKDMKNKSVSPEVIKNIAEGNYEQVNSLLEDAVKNIMQRKLFEMKKMVAAKLSEAAMLPNGRVRTSTGEELSQSVLKARRGLTESNVERERFKDQAKKALEDEEAYGKSESGEINRANLNRETIIGYKQRREEMYKAAAANAVQEHGNDIEKAAKHMHEKLRSKEFSGQPWHSRIDKDWKDLPESERTNFRVSITGHISNQEKMKDPKYVERMQKSAQIGIQRQKDMDEMEARHKEQMAAHLRKQAGLVNPEPNKPIDWKSKLKDEIPHLDKKLQEAKTKAQKLAQLPDQKGLPEETPKSTIAERRR